MWIWYLFLRWGLAVVLDKVTLMRQMWRCLTNVSGEMIVFIFLLSVRLWLYMFIGWGGRPEAPHQSFGSRAWATRGKSLFCGNTNKVKASCVSQTVLGKEVLSVGGRRDVRRSLSKLLEVWFPQQVIFKIDSAFLVWIDGITMIGQYEVWRSWSGECARPSTVRDPCRNSVLSFGGHHELQVVPQKSTEGQRQKAFWVWAGGF